MWKSLVFNSKKEKAKIKGRTDKMYLSEGKAKELDVEKVAYELYKQDWVCKHISPEEQLSTMLRYYECVQMCVEDNYPIESYEEWLSDVGYGACSLYAYFDEFLCHEFQDEEYMKGLIKENSYLWPLYQSRLQEYEKDIEIF